MDSNKRYWWTIGIELKFRQLSGDAFQDFIGRILQTRYGEDYIRVRAFGRRGDKGCDGYLGSTGRVYACYGAVNGDSSKVDTLIKKIGSDFAKASKSLRLIMKEWYMVHNLVDGLPIEAVEALKALEAKNPEVNFRFAAIESIKEIIFALDEGAIEQFIGPAATSADAQNLQIGEVRDLVAGILAAVDEAPPDLATIKEVSPGKIKHNDLPPHWTFFISAGWQNAHHVEAYFKRHYDALAGERVAHYFRDRYSYLKAQGLNAAAIMIALYEMIVGVGSVGPDQMIAAQAIFAHFVESCDILEDIPKAEVSL